MVPIHYRKPPATNLSVERTDLLGGPDVLSKAASGQCQCCSSASLRQTRILRSPSLDRGCRQTGVEEPSAGRTSAFREWLLSRRHPGPAFRTDRRQYGRGERRGLWGREPVSIHPT